MLHKLSFAYYSKQPGVKPVPDQKYIKCLEFSTH